MNSILPVSVTEPAALYLRQATAAEHQRIEQCRPLTRLFATNYTLDEYRQLLIGLFGFYSVLEPMLLTGLPDTARPLLESRRKTGWLAQDLTEFGLTSAQITTVPRHFRSPSPGNFAEQIGGWYVLEGATLGGQLIRRRLRQQFGPSIDNRLHFYSGYGDRTGRQWRLFQQFLNSSFSPSDYPALFRGATVTFTAMADWLESPT